MKIIEPTKDRSSFFNGSETIKVKYKFVCSQCRKKSIINFKQILDAAWGWVDKFESEELNKIADTFDINLNNRSIADGMTAIIKHHCACGAEHYIYFWFDEYRNSCYDISLKGIVKK